MAVMKSAPGATEISSWQSQIIKPGATVGGTTTSGGVNATANPAAVKLYNMTVDERKQLALTLKNAGYKVPISGQFSDSLLNAYTGAVASAQSQAMQLGQEFNDNFFLAYIARETAAVSADGAKIDTVRQRQAYRPETIEATIDEVFTGVLGRAASDAEKKKYLARIEKKLSKVENMQTTQYKDVGGGVQQVTTTEAFSPKQFLYEQISGTDEAKRQQVMSYYDVFKRALGVS